MDFTNELSINLPNRDQDTIRPKSTNKRYNNDYENDLSFKRSSSNTKISFEIRNKFQKILGKLNDNSTKEIAFTELKQIINENNSKEDLRSYISSLSLYYNNCTHQAKEVQVLLLGYIASVYKENLCDPLDKNPSILLTIKRIFEIIKLYMKENSFGIHKACSHSLLEILDNCMMKDNDSLLLEYFFDPLIEILLTGSNKYAQIASTICINDLIIYFNINGYKSVLDKISIVLISILLKSKCDSSYLYEGLNNLINFVSFDIFLENLKEIYEKLINTLYNSQNYLTKIEICKIFKRIANVLIPMVNTLTGFFNREVIIALQFITKDKIHKVQQAGQDALTEWYTLEKKFLEFEKKKTQLKNNFCEEETNSKSSSNKFNLLRNLSKLNKYNTNDQVKQEIYSKGISNILRTSNFINKKESSITNKKLTTNINPSPENVHKELIKSSIKNYVKRNFSHKDETANNDILYMKENNRTKKIILNDKIDFGIETKELEDNNINKKMIVSSVLRMENMFRNFMETMTKRINKVNGKIESLEAKIVKLKSKRLRTNTEMNHKLRVSNNNTIRYDSSNEFNITLIKDTGNLLKENNKYNYNNEIKQDEIDYLKNEDTGSINLWKKILSHINFHDLNSAYETVLNSDDDIFLFRLLFITGSVLNRLNFDISKKLLYRLNIINKSYMFQEITYNVIAQSYEINMFNYLSDEFKNELLDTLYEFSLIETDLGKKAEYLYSYIRGNEIPSI